MRSRGIQDGAMESENWMDSAGAGSQQVALWAITESFCPRWAFNG